MGNIKLYKDKRFIFSLIDSFYSLKHHVHTFILALFNIKLFTDNRIIFMISIDT